jgi:hypothetical protein
MDTSERIAANIEYRCVLLRRATGHVLAFKEEGQQHLPRIRIPDRTRPAEQLQKAIRAQWGLEVFVLETHAAGNRAGAYVTAELLTHERSTVLDEIPFRRLKDCELSAEDLGHLELLVRGETDFPCSRLGWIEEAVAWIESQSGAKFSLKRDIEQLNAGGGFALFRARSDDGRVYWLKATGKANKHEFAVTRFLSELCPEFLPTIAQFKIEWNAWLMEDAGASISEPPGAEELGLAASRMSRMQLLTIGRTAALLGAGAFDLRLPRLRSHIDRVIEYLTEAMTRQTSIKAVPLSGDRLREIGEILRDAFCRVEDLRIPDTLIHNDLNLGNILSNGGKLVFTDWSEAAIGNPFTACERLCRLNPSHCEDVQAAYKDRWSELLDQQTIESAFHLMPLLSIYACLHGRGQWLAEPDNVPLQLESYRRSLARHMDRAAKRLVLVGALCH